MPEPSAVASSVVAHAVAEEMSFRVSMFSEGGRNAGVGRCVIQAEATSKARESFGKEVINVENSCANCW